MMMISCRPKRFCVNVRFPRRLRCHRYSLAPNRAPQPAGKCTPADGTGLKPNTLLAEGILRLFRLSLERVGPALPTPHTVRQLLLPTHDISAPLENVSAPVALRHPVAHAKLSANWFWATRDPAGRSRFAEVARERLKTLRLRQARAFRAFLCSNWSMCAQWSMHEWDKTVCAVSDVCF